MPRHTRNLPVAFLLSALLIVVAGARPVAAEIVRLPVTIDYPLLQNLMINKAFRERNESVVLVNEGSGCLYLALAHPRIVEEKGFVRLEIEITAHAGTPLGSECLMPLAWRGFLVLYQQPVINSQTWQLSFRTSRSGLFDADHQPVNLGGVLWQLIESRVFAYLNAITIDLAPPVNNLKEFLFPMFPPQVRQQTQAMLDSLRAGEPVITPEAIKLDILADVKEIYKPEDARLTETLSGKELEEVVAVWENWDALLSFMVATTAKDVLSPEERQILMDVLLETRYSFLDSLGNHAVTHDLVRVQFANAWKQLAPIFRNHITADASPQKIGYFSFFTAADALIVLDGLGPTFGIEVSRNGLIRLARMLSSDPAILRYGSGVNPNLQRLFQVSPEPVEAPPVPDEPPPAGGFLEQDLPLTPPPQVPEPTPPPTPTPEQPVAPIPESNPAPAPTPEQPVAPIPESNPAPAPTPEQPVAPIPESTPTLEQPVAPIPESTPTPAPTLEQPVAPIPESTPESTPDSTSEPTSSLFDFFCAPLHAAEGRNLEEIRKWMVTEGDVDGHVRKVVNLLKAQAQTTAREKNIPPAFRSTYRLMVPAMAWQESCFRQFVVRNNQLTYLLSYNNSSVGLMQVNTRVWRGVYDLERLRWDIRYNAAAGCEIATLYLKDYALRDRKGQKKPDNESIARLVYAMYNGGPAQYRKYLERERTGRLYDSDRLFQEKFDWVTTADWGKISNCLSGG